MYDGVSLCVTVHLTFFHNIKPPETNKRHTVIFSTETLWSTVWRILAVINTNGCRFPLVCPVMGSAGRMKVPHYVHFQVICRNPTQQVIRKNRQTGGKKQLMFTTLFTASNKKLLVITFFETDALLCCKASTRKTEGRLSGLCWH